MSTVIRPLVAEDEDGWRALWDGYLDFYREQLPEATTRATFERLVEASELFGFVAEADGALVGLVHALTHASTWSTTSYCYLEDLYVSPAGRGTSTASDLITAVAVESARRGCEKVYWHTQEYNGRARSLYDQVARRTSFIVYERDPG